MKWIDGVEWVLVPREPSQEWLDEFANRLDIGSEDALDIIAALPGDGSAQGGRYSQAMIESAEALGHHDNAEYMRQRAATGKVPDRINAVAEKINRLAWQQHTMGGVGWLGAELLKLEKELRSLATPPASTQGDGS